MKRALDVTVAATALLVLSPLFAIIAAAVWLDEPGPIIFRGRRVGRGSREFSILKFRSMRLHAPAGIEVTVWRDPRVTPVGRVLRATKLDELPQLFNVIRGDMSLVGPRPESPVYVAFYSEAQRRVLSVRPGITGLAQIAYRHEERLLTGEDPERYYITQLMPTKLALDLQYVAMQSLPLDFKIILKTVGTLVRRAPQPALMTPAAMSAGLGATEHIHTAQLDVEQTPQPAASGRIRAEMQDWLQHHIVRRIRSYGLSVMLDVVIVSCAFDTATVLQYADTGTSDVQLTRLFLPNILIGCVYAVVSYAYGLHRRLWRYASMRDIWRLLQVLVVTVALVAILDVLRVPLVDVPLPSIVIAGAMYALLFLGAVKVFPRLIAAVRHAKATATITRVLIVGAGDAGASLANRLMYNRGQGYAVIAFVDDDRSKWSRHIHGRPVYGPISSIPALAANFKIDLIAIALPSVGAERVGQILSICQQTSARVQIMPGLSEAIRGEPYQVSLREVNVADLLGREVISLQASEAQNTLRDKVIMVTGAAGSIGSELCRQLIAFEPRRLIALDNNETGLFDLAETLQGDSMADRLVTRIGDITSQADMAFLFAEERPDLVFHAAAYKHVPLLERHPEQAAQTNILGTYLLCRLAREYAVSSFVFISSDKAADPVNVLGASKRIGERIVQAMALAASDHTRYCAVRFGNVIGSRGSVVPTFTKQIEHGGPITVTDPETTRYFMTIPEACGLVILTSTLAESGSLFLLDMGEPVRIADLASKMTRLRGLRVDRDIAIRYTGLRPGERLHEVLAAPDERLAPTPYDKILHVTGADVAPSMDDLTQWMRMFHEHLDRHDTTSVRHLMFALAESRVPAPQP